MPPATDPDILTCLATAQTKASLAIDKYCNDAVYPDSIPDCGGYPNGASWASLANQAVENFVPGFFCAE
jgi:hypothetical protein